jgi:hypothetical protein
MIEFVEKGDDSVWISYDAFVKKFHGDYYKPSNMPVGTAAANADTRNIHQVHDLNVIFSQEVTPKETDSTSSPLKSELLVHGTVSTSTQFAFHVNEQDNLIGEVVSLMKLSILNCF